jgi:hypothetical protein
MVLGVAVLGACNSLAPTLESSSGMAGYPQGTGGSGSDASREGSASVTSCHPASVETFAAATYRHALPPGQGACDPDLINAYYVDCLAPLTASKSVCDAFAQANATCAACITTDEAASAYGPLVLVDGYVQANVAGCIEVEDPSDRSCAMAQQALSDCELAACAVNCPVVDQSSFAAYEACAAQADATGCQAYYAAAQCLSAEVDAGDAGPESACLASDFKHFYDVVVPLFCGAPSNDAGPAQDVGVSDTLAGSPGDAGPGDGAGGDGEAGIAVIEGGQDAEGEDAGRGADAGVPDAAEQRDGAVRDAPSADAAPDGGTL